MKSDKIFNKGIWIIVLLISCNVSLAQQEPLYTQYMFNMQTINPAYTGTWGSLGFIALTRYQWAGIDNAPATQTFSIQSPFLKENIGLGLNIVNDKFGLEKRFSMYGDYSYKLRATERTDLRFGLKFGFTNYSNNLYAYDLPNQRTVEDPFFSGEIDNKIMPNFGVGVFLSNEKYYVGFSIPKLLENEFTNNFNNFSTLAEVRHYFLTAGYIFDLSPYVKFKPTMLAKLTANAPVQTDFSTNFLLRDQFWLGAMYRTGDSFGFIAQWIMNKRLRLGYAVDFSTSKLRNYNNGTHEIMVSYEISYVKNEFISPRHY